MVLILSEDNDQSTDGVIDWLEYYNANYIRINSADVVQLLRVSFAPLPYFIIRVNGQIIHSNKITKYWYRRGLLNLKVHVSIPPFERLREHLNDELVDLTQFVYSILDDKPKINSFSDNFLNKLIVLKKAQNVGLQIPETIITTALGDLVDLPHDKLISKSIKNNPVLIKNNKTYSCQTVLIKDKVLNPITESFFPSLVQTYIEKSFEVRSFYLHGCFYSMAIFSQNDEMTVVDYRNYNMQKMNRMVPYIIPSTLEYKLRRLFECLKLDSGSADIICDSSGNYIFLEINPIGQFGMVSTPCNYYLEREIASYLC